jgi:hypothetical protein
VEEFERFPELLEAMEPGWRIYPLGMSGYGPDLMLRALEHVGLRVSPDVVVLCLYTDDLRRVHPFYAGAGFPIPKYRLEAGRLITVQYPSPSVMDALRLVGVARQAQWRLTDGETKLNQAILDRFVDLSVERGFTLAMVFLPDTSDDGVDRRRRTWLSRYASGRRVRFLDLTDAIVGASAELFIPGNPHWNSRGHQVAASRIREFLTPVLSR